MKVRLLVGISGPDGALKAGDVYDTADDGEATRLISARYALPYREEQIERAVIADPIERAVAKPPSRKKG